MDPGEALPLGAAGAAETMAAMPERITVDLMMALSVGLCLQNRSAGEGGRMGMNA